MIWDFLEPSDFSGDAYGWLTNQAAHFVLGGLVQLLLGLWWVPAYLCLEVVQWLIGSTIIDGIEDFLFVTVGAFVSNELRRDNDRRAAIAFGVFAIALAIGWLI